LVAASVGQLAFSRRVELVDTPTWHQAYGFRTRLTKGIRNTRPEAGQVPSRTSLHQCTITSVHLCTGRPIYSLCMCIIHVASACLGAPAGQHIIVPVNRMILAVKSGPRVRFPDHGLSSMSVRCIGVTGSSCIRIRDGRDGKTCHRVGRDRTGFHGRLPYAVMCPRLRVACCFCLGFNIELGPMLWLRGRVSAADFWTRFCGRGGPPCGQFLYRH
jgi:hypothetical protein